jgi:hypothetical protein
MAESNAAYNTLVLKSVNEVNIKDTGHEWIEDGKPIGLDLLLVCRQTLKVQLSKSVANTELGRSVIRGGVLAHLW